MAGYSRIYCIGGLGGFIGADGINPILFQVLVGDGSRQWLEALYVKRNIKRLGRVKKIIPERPDDVSALLDACIAFYPEHFKGCPSLAKVEKELGQAEMLDFDASKSKIPRSWSILRKEAEPFYKQLNIWFAELRPLEH